MQLKMQQELFAVWLADLSTSRGHTECLQKAHGRVGVAMSAGGLRKSAWEEKC